MTYDVVHNQTIFSLYIDTGGPAAQILVAGDWGSVTASDFVL